MSNAILCLKIALAFALGLIAASLISIYGLPFSGCPRSGNLFTYPGCTIWPQFFRGIFFTFPFLAIMFKHKFIKHLPLLILFAISCAGGFEGVLTGEYISITSLQDVAYNLMANWPLLAGATFVAISATAFSKFLVTNK